MKGRRRPDHAIRNVRREQRTLQGIDVRNRSACPTPRRVLSKRMSEHKVTLTWQRGDKPFEYQKYSRDHTWKFEGGHEMQASAAPAYLGNEKLVDPEEAFVASLSSCHMLTFLAIACKKRFVLDEYLDEVFIADQRAALVACGPIGADGSADHRAVVAHDLARHKADPQNVGVAVLATEAQPFA